MTKCFLIIFLWLCYLNTANCPYKEGDVIVNGFKITSFSKYLFGKSIKYNISSPPHFNWGGLKNRWTNSNAWDIFVEENTPVYSIIEGKVFSTRFHENGKTVWGHNIIIENDKEKIFYTHLDEIVVCQGDNIESGQLIGYVGKWPAYYRFPDGTHMPSHLHIAIYNHTLERYLTNDLKIQNKVSSFSIRGILDI